MPDIFRKYFERLFGRCFGKKALSPPRTPTVGVTPKKQDKIKRQASKKKNAKITTGGVAFDVGFRPATPNARAPSRIQKEKSEMSEEQMEFYMESKQMCAEMHRINAENAKIKKARSFYKR